MTPEENEAANRALVQWQEDHPDTWGDQDENGIDLAHLRENLKLTPVERLQRLDAGRESLEWIRNVRTTRPIRQSNPPLL